MLNAQNQPPHKTEVQTSSFCSIWFGVDLDRCRATDIFNQIVAQYEPAPGQWVSMGSQNGTQPGLELSSQDIFPSPTCLGQLS
jgi:hypothetical protein